MNQLLIDNLDPDRFVLWTPPPGTTVSTGATRHPVPLPALPLPLHGADLPKEPPDADAIGQGLYDYLRQFPDCQGNVSYATLLRDAFPHYLDDLAAHAVMLDAKQVEPAYVLRKLTALKILQLLEPDNTSLLFELCRGWFEMALEFAELPRLQHHLRQALRYGQELLRRDPDHLGGLVILIDIDLLLGDTPAAAAKWLRVAGRVQDPHSAQRFNQRCAECERFAHQGISLAVELELVAEALRLHARGDDPAAVELLEAVESRGLLTGQLPSADFYWLLGVCRRSAADPAGALVAWHRALELEPAHAAVLAALEQE